MVNASEYLKSAKAALQTHAYPEAINLCGAVLREDPANFMALIVMGAAQTGAGDAAALASFRRAIGANAASALGHQGLVKHYRRWGAAGGALGEYAAALLRLREMGNISASDACEALYEAAAPAEDFAECSSVVREMLQVEHADGEERARILGVAVKVVSCKAPTPLDDERELLEAVVASVKPESLSYYFLVKYLRGVLERSGFDLVLDRVLEMGSFPYSLLVKEWTCKCFFERKVVHLSAFRCDEAKIDSIAADVCEMSPNSPAALLHKALKSLLDKKPLNAYLIVERFKANEDVFTSLLRARCCLDLNRWKEAEVILRQAINNDMDATIEISVKHLLFVALCSQNNPDKCSEGLTLSESFDRSYDESENLALFNAYLTLDRIADAEVQIKTLSDAKLYSYAQSILLEKQKKIDEAFEIVESDADNYLNLLRVGILQIDYRNDYARAFVPLLQSAKLYPFDFRTFLYLGNLYKRDGGNHEKAKKCYLKALELNPECPEAARNLSAVYLESKDWEANYALLHSIIKSLVHDDRHKFQWVWLQLGFHHIARQQWDDAIVNLRTYMRLNSSDPEAWAVLADSYYFRGSYTSALKCYQKVIELKPDNKHCSIQIGTIQCLLRQYDEALVTFETVSDDYLLPALKGMAEVKLCMAKDLYSKSLYDACQESAQEAVDMVCRAMPIKEATCLWKILYNTILTITKLPKKCRFLNFNRDFLGSDSKIKYVDSELFDLAKECIMKTINMTDGKNDHLYNDLSFAYYQFYETSKNKMYIEEAFAAIKKCLELGNSRWQHWNLLAIISSSPDIQKYDVAQHAFVKALELDPINSILWSNLGVFYSLMGEYKIANQAFMKAQESNPTYVKSWIGQAMLAELVDDKETIDLYRHSSQLSFNVESSSKYGYWVARTICTDSRQSSSYKNTKGGDYAFLSASDMMAVNCEFEENNSYNLNIYGILLEKIGKHKSARQMFQRALENVEDEHKDKVLSNLGRIHYKLKEYESAIRTLKSIKETDIDSYCLLALSYFKNGNHHESYAAYKKSYEWLKKRQTEKPELLLATSCILVSADDAEGAKLLLFQAMQSDGARLNKNDLLALCGVSVRASDPHLGSLALTEMRKDKTIDSTLWCIFQVYMISKYEGRERAMRFVSRLVHRSPADGDLWRLLTMVMDRNVRTFNACARRAIAHGEQNKHKTMERLLCVSEALLGRPNGKSHVWAQKALKKDPSDSRNWTLLALTLPKEEKGRDWLVKATPYILKNFSLDDKYKAWLTNIGQYF